MRSSVYGLAAADLTQAKNEIERLIRITLEAHDSYYRAGDYYRYRGPGAEIILQRNYDPIDEAPAEEKAAELPVVVYVDTDVAARGMDQTLEQMPAAKLIRRVDRPD